MVIKGDGADRLESPLNILRINNSVEIKPLHAGHGGSNKSVPEELKDIAAITAKLGAPHRAIAESLDLSASRVSDYNKGKGGKDFDAERRDKNNKIADVLKSDIRKRALDKLMDSLSAVTPAKLEALGALDASRVAVNMSAVVNKLEPKDAEVNINGNVVFFTPARLTKGEYNIIDVEAQTV